MDEVKNNNGEALAGQPNQAEEFYGETLVDFPTLAAHIRRHEQIRVDVKLLDARVYPTGTVRLVRHLRRSRGSMNVKNFLDKYRRDYPGLDFEVPFHGRTRLDTARRRP